MKTSLLVASLVVIGSVAFNVIGLPGALTAASAAVLFTLLLGDYSRRPRFRVRSPYHSTAAARFAPKPATHDDPALWTYATHVK